VTSYSRQDVLRILQISSNQLHGLERAGLIPQQQTYTFQDLGQLRTLRALREESVPAASIRLSIDAMKAVSGMSNPLLEACLVRTGTRLAFRHSGYVVDPIRRQFLFDFERLDQLDRDGQPDRLGHPGRFGRPASGFEPSPLRRGATSPRGVQDRFLAAVQAEEAGEKPRAIALYEEILSIDPKYAAAYINLGTILFHQRNFTLAEELYRRATEVDSSYVLAFFDLGNVLDELQRLDESIAAYRQAVALSPRYADAHYNLALAYERKGDRRKALGHWQSYIKLDQSGPWAEHARTQIRKLLSQEKLSVASRSTGYVPPAAGRAALRLV
jgi:tetratricopeptide (TPR) repeat protein